MSKKTTNLTYDELIAIAPKHIPFKIRVQSNPKGEGGEQILTAKITATVLHTSFDRQYYINGVDYAWGTSWRDEYKGTFDLIEEDEKENKSANELANEYFGTESKGFDPENLTFDGVKIEVGDEVEISNISSKFKVNTDGDTLAMIMKGVQGNQYQVLIPICFLNITAHYPKPKKDEELERLESEFQSIDETIFNNSSMLRSEHELCLDRYYQARKHLEDYKSKNNIK